MDDLIDGVAHVYLLLVADQIEHEGVVPAGRRKAEGDDGDQHKDQLAFDGAELFHGRAPPFFCRNSVGVTPKNALNIPVKWW